jgi:hypothetical protein
MGAQAFDLVLADADLDGDPDLLINWHHLGPFESFINVDGVLRPRDPGLAANPAAPGLFSSAFDAERAAQTPGLYLWHDLERAGAWQFLWTDPAKLHGAVTVELETSLRFKMHSGLSDTEVAGTDERHLILTIPPGSARRRFSVTTDPIGVQLIVRLRAGAAGVPPLFAGVPPVSQPGEVSLWKPDPHGMAWVDVEGTNHAELVVTRGGLSGELLPPMPPKADAYYVFDEGFMLRPLPPGYGRGRAVEWVDIDNDGVLELSVANEATANRLFVRGNDGFEDRAAALGIDFDRAEVQCWADVDGDGLQDLYVLEDGGVSIWFNREGQRFERSESPKHEMPLPVVPTREPSDLFDRAGLRLADFDADGDLDLWVLGRGAERRNTLFLREGEGWVNAGRQAGFDLISGSLVAVPADYDNDGYEDLFAPGANPALWMNDRGRRLEPLDPGLVLDPRTEAAAAADIDGDGRIDIAVAGWDRSILMNRIRADGSFTVELLDSRGTPVGALVTAIYPDGRRVRRRLGSERTSFSQVAEPLRFASGASSIEVVWPGDRSVAVHEMPGSARVVLERRR